jgi:hypothetical protein
MPVGLERPECMHKRNRISPSRNRQKQSALISEQLLSTDEIQNLVFKITQHKALAKKWA